MLSRLWSPPFGSLVIGHDKVTPVFRLEMETDRVTGWVEILQTAAQAG